MGNAATIKVFMRSQEHPDSAGWVARLKTHDANFRASSSHAGFGRLSHIIKKDGAFVRLQQGVRSENTTEFASLSAEQRQILNTLVQIGIVAKITG